MGGEPLLREDIGKIIDYTKGKGIYCGLNTNGILVKKKINEIKNIDLLQLSFDGPKEFHDKQRGGGSYDAVIEALQIAKPRGIKTAFNITLTKYNVNYLQEIVEFFEEENVKTYIQPVAPFF